MPALRRRLTAGEEVVLDVRPHWSTLAAPVVLLAAVIAGAVTALVDGVPTWVDWPVLVVLSLAALWLLARYLTWSNTRLVLTTWRVIERRGVLARTTREIPLAAVSEVGVRRSLMERMIGTGSLVIESAARDGAEVFPSLPRPALLRDEIYDRMAQAARPGPQAAGFQAAGREPSIPEQIDQLDRLRRRGALSDEEFERKKTELLDRL
ncbi:MAG TPA: PH domain-containing protein [Acidimicrobiales bacterium]|nr:PH domain-containing protein [Acidimicrobiales bacterium]